MATDDVLTIVFGIIAVLLAVMGVLIAYLQLRQVKPRPDNEAADTVELRTSS